MPSTQDCGQQRQCRFGWVPEMDQPRRGNNHAEAHLSNHRGRLTLAQQAGFTCRDPPGRTNGRFF